jgi:hypothetical protein
MTFSRFNPGETRSLAARMADQAREAEAPKVSNRQFVIALTAILIALALFGVLLMWL